MKRSKRIISIFLALLMLASTVSVFNIAFAADLDEKKEEETISAVENGEITIDKAGQEIIAAYDKLANSNKELTPEQQEKLEKLQGLVTDYGNKTAESLLSGLNSIIDDGSAIAAKLFSTSTDKKVAQVETMISEYNGKLSISKPADMDKITEEDIKGYDDIIAAFNALSDSQKDMVNIFMFDKMLKLIYDRESAKLIVGGSTSSAARKLVNAKVKDVIGEIPFLVNAEAIGRVVKDTKATPQEKLDAYKKATNEKERIYAGLWYVSYEQFYYKAEGYSASGFGDVVTAFAKADIAANPYSEERPTSVTKPKDKDYPLGTEDPEYIAKLEEYNQYKIADAKWTVSRNVYEGSLYIAAMQKVADETAPEYVDIVKYINSSIDASQAFDLNHSDYKKATSSKAMFDAMSEMQQRYVNDLSITCYSIFTMASYGPTYANKKAKDFYVLCTEIEEYKALADFEELINSTRAPYTQDTLTTVVEAYNAVPSSFKGEINKDVMSKYNDILFEVLTHSQSQEKPVITDYVKTTVKYPIGTNHDKIESALPLIEEVILTKLSPVLGLPEGGLTEVISTSLYTNATVATLTAKLYKLLGGLSSLIAYSPDQLAAKLIEPEYAGAVTALNAAKEANTTDDKLASWDNFTMKNGDMFTDGDREAFLDAMSAMFRQLSILNMAITLTNTFSSTKATYEYGGYEDLVPIFEALDVDCMSSVEYTKYVEDVKAENSTKDMDAKFRPILEAVCNLIDKVAANPVIEISNLLPKLAYALKTDLIDTQIQKLASKVGFVTIPEFSLKTDALFDIIAPILSGLVINETALPITLDKEKFLSFVNDEAGCGTATVKYSISGTNAYRVDIVSDKADAFLVLFRAAYGMITRDENISSIKTYIDSTDMGTIEKLGIKAALSALSIMPADVAFTALINIINPPKIDTPTTPEDPENPTNTENPTTPDGKPITDNPSIPKTGAKIFGVVASAFAVAAAGAVVAVKMKKKED